MLLADLLNSEFAQNPCIWSCLKPGNDLARYIVSCQSLSRCGTAGSVMVWGEPRPHSALPRACRAMGTSAWSWTCGSAQGPPELQSLRPCQLQSKVWSAELQVAVSTFAPKERRDTDTPTCPRSVEAASLFDFWERPKTGPDTSQCDTECGICPEGGEATNPTVRWEALARWWLGQGAGRSLLACVHMPYIYPPRLHI